MYEEWRTTVKWATITGISEQNIKVAKSEMLRAASRMGNGKECCCKCQMLNGLMYLWHNSKRHNGNCA